MYIYLLLNSCLADKYFSRHKLFIILIVMLRISALQREKASLLYNKHNKFYADYAELETTESKQESGFAVESKFNYAMRYFWNYPTISNLIYVDATHTSCCFMDRVNTVATIG